MMNTTRNTARTTLFVLMIALLSIQLQSVQAQTQNQTEALTGIIEKLDQDYGSITVSGRVLGYSETVTRIYIGQRRVGAQALDTGMVVRYVLDAQGTLLRMELLGPAEKLQMLERH
ncbi:MAG: hypothetical protein RQ757_01180 [Pseudomonadales bacterium]|nr:hypothetical protein [Pseudomonadales bacterium]